MKLKKCPKCSNYTLKNSCPKCKQKTKSAHYKFVKKIKKEHPASPKKNLL